MQQALLLKMRLVQRPIAGQGSLQPMMLASDNTALAAAVIKAVLQSR
jgi:hypothetical protein